MARPEVRPVAHPVEMEPEAWDSEGGGRIGLPPTIGSRSRVRRYDPW